MAALAAEATAMGNRPRLARATSTTLAIGLTSFDLALDASAVAHQRVTSSPDPASPHSSITILSVGMPPMA